MPLQRRIFFLRLFFPHPCYASNRTQSIAILFFGILLTMVLEGLHLFASTLNRLNVPLPLAFDLPASLDYRILVISKIIMTCIDTPLPVTVSDGQSHVHIRLMLDRYCPGRIARIFSFLFFGRSLVGLGTGVLCVLLCLGGFGPSIPTFPRSVHNNLHFPPSPIEKETIYCDRFFP